MTRMYSVRAYKISRGKAQNLRKAIVLAESNAEAREKFLKVVGALPTGAYLEARETLGDVYTFSCN